MSFDLIKAIAVPRRNGWDGMGWVGMIVTASTTTTTTTATTLSLDPETIIHVVFNAI